MAIHWKIPFKSLRTQTTYTVNVYDASFSGTAITMKGAAQPFVTEEDADEDMFMPVRTQTGYLRVVDDGKDASGNVLSAANSVKAMIPTKDTDRLVTVTTTSGSTTTIHWIGYMQAQNFSGNMYETPQEREFPVQCLLSVLGSFNVDSNTGLSNFYNLIYKAFNSLPLSSGVSLGYFYIQGGSNAQTWLMSQFDWMNLLNVSGGEVKPAYNYLEALEDMCRFWGWTMRMNGKDIYLSCADDQNVNGDCLRMTLANMSTAAGGTTAGTISGDYLSSKAIGVNFASTDQTEEMIQGVDAATVTADVNADTIGVDTTDDAMQDVLEDGASWNWQGDSNVRVGYHYTTGKTSFATDLFEGSISASGKAVFQRTVFYESEESENGSECTVIHMLTASTDGHYAQIATKRQHRFGEGRIELSADIYNTDGENISGNSNDNLIHMMIGIGPSANDPTTKWFHMKKNVSSYVESIDAGWVANNASDKNFMVMSQTGSKIGPGVIKTIAGMFVEETHIFAAIPTEAGLRGKIFVRFLGKGKSADAEFFIANFKLEFTRNTAYIPNTLWSQQHPARVINKRREDRHEYRTGVATNAGSRNWDVDVIYATDNNSQYGYGLLMTSAGAWMTGVQFTTSGSSERPEQHLCDRVAAYHNQSRKRLTLDMQQSSSTAVTPRNTVTIDNVTYWPVAVSRKWRDDVTTITMQEI